MPIERRYLSETEELGKPLIKERTPEVFTKSDGGVCFKKGSKYGAFDNVFIGSHGNGLYGGA